MNIFKQVGIWVIGGIIIYIIFFSGSFSKVTDGPTAIALKYGSKINVSSYDKFYKKSSFIGWNLYNQDKEYLILELQKTYYDFCNFTYRDWENYKKSDSLEKYFNKNIKGKYNCR